MEDDDDDEDDGDDDDVIDDAEAVCGPDGAIDTLAMGQTWLIGTEAGSTLGCKTLQGLKGNNEGFAKLTSIASLIASNQSSFSCDVGTEK